MDKLILGFQYTKEEYVRAYRRYLLASKTVTPFSVAALGALLAGSVIFLAVSGVNALSVIMAVISAMSAILLFHLYVLMPPGLFKKTRQFNGPYSITFTDEIIYFKTVVIDSTINWDAYMEIWEDGEYFYLIQGPRLFSLIPKRVFGGGEELDTFLRMAGKRLEIKRL